MGYRLIESAEGTTPSPTASLAWGKVGVLRGIGIVQRRWIVIAVLSVVTLIGIVLRLHGLEESTISHPEIFVPGIDLPYGLADPSPRFTLFKVIGGTVALDVHPPAYYMLMLGWTKFFGAGIFALRLPSVLFGAASILLIYVLGNLAQDKWTGLLAAGMLALNGHQIFWSQEARMYAMACFLGLLSTVLLLVVDKRSTWQRTLQFLYVAVSVVGLATEYYFWPILFAQMVYAFVRSCIKKTATPALLRLQLFILILASPILAIAAVQSQRPSYLGTDLVLGVGQFLQFGFLFESEPLSTPRTFVPPYATFLLVLVAVFLLGRGLVSKGSRATEDLVAGGPPPFIMILSGVGAFLSILVFAASLQDWGPGVTEIAVAASAIPLFLLFADFLLRRYWPLVLKTGVLQNRRLALLADAGSLVSLLAILPVTLVVGVSLFNPIYASRGALLFTPYLLIVLSRGILSLFRRRVYLVAAVLVLVMVHSLSILHHDQRLHSPTDYKGLAEEWVPEIKDSDLIFVRRHWVITPIFYYLKPGRYDLVGGNYRAEVAQRPDARVWFVSTPGVGMTEEIADAIQSYNVVKKIEALRIQTVLYERP
ncbi:MAG: glycosyltransferase family 39 protein [Anaerolineae bacterium]|nr:glycosyltransferase family 39 protein [Anaerolineae bacterium]